MNEETRYVLGIYQLAVAIEDSLEYAVPGIINQEPTELVEKYEQRRLLVEHLLEENSPIMSFCRNNGEVGSRIKSQLVEFAKDIYSIGEDASLSPVVSLVNNAEGKKEIRVDNSLLNHLIDLVVGLHETLTDIDAGYIESFKKTGVLEDKLLDLVKVGDRSYRGRALFVISTNLVTKFQEYNRTVREYVNTQERLGNVVDISKLKPDCDPNVFFVNQELSKLFGYANFVIQHNKTEDPDFLALIAEYEDKKLYFSGVKRPEDGKSMQDCLQDFQRIFALELQQSTGKWLECYQAIFNELLAYESETRQKLEDDAVAEAGLSEESK